MIETLFQAYLPLLLWTGLGILFARFLPQSLPRLLGRSLYWVGVPWQILALARYTEFASSAKLVPIITLATLGIGLILAWVVYQGCLWLSFAVPLGAAGEGRIGVGLRSVWKWLQPWLPLGDRARQGSFILAAMIGNTGFVGLGILPTLISPAAFGWAIFFSVTQNLVGTYGIGVLLASYYGRSQQKTHPWWRPLRDMVTVPTLWTFVIGYSTQSVALPSWIDTTIQSSLLFVIPASFLLMGIRLSQLQGWKSLRPALFPVVLKLVLMPALVGLGMTLVGLGGDPRLAIVLMAGMPCAFAGLILAEEYDLDRDLASSTIAVSTIGVLVMIPLWLALFS